MDARPAETQYFSKEIFPKSPYDRAIGEERFLVQRLVFFTRDTLVPDRPGVR